MMVQQPRHIKIDVQWREAMCLGVAIWCAGQRTVRPPGLRWRLHVPISRVQMLVQMLTWRTVSSTATSGSAPMRLMKAVNTVGERCKSTCSV